MWGFKKALTFYYTAKEKDALAYVKVLGILFPPLDAGYRVYGIGTIDGCKEHKIKTKYSYNVWIVNNAKILLCKYIKAINKLLARSEMIRDILKKQKKTKGKQKELVVRKFTLSSKFKRADFKSRKSLFNRYKALKKSNLKI